MEQVNKAWTTSDPAAINGLALDSCKTCANFAETAVTLQRTQRRYAGRAISLGLSAELPESSANLVFIQAPLIQEQQKILGRQGATSELVKRKVVGAVLSAAWGDKGWKMHKIHVEQAS